MCGRVYVKTGVEQLIRNFAFAHAGTEVRGLDNQFPRFNGAPRQDYPLIVREPDYPGGMFTTARWGFIPSFAKEPKPKSQPINARSEGIARQGMFKSAYATKRALLPIDGFYEWKAIKGEKARRPYAITMKSGEPFAIAALYDERRDPVTGLTDRTFCVLTCPANELVGQIHDRMPVIVAPQDYQRWIGEEAGPSDLLVPFPSELMTICPISSRVNDYRNETPDLLEPVETKASQ